MTTAQITTVMSTVPQRRTLRAPTVRQLDMLGLHPILIEQDPAMPLGHASRRETAAKALDAGLRSGAPLILAVEDDIDIDPEILHELAPADTPVWFWHRPRFAPQAACRGPARDATHMWGAQAVLFTRTQASRAIRLARAPARPRDGFDVAIRPLGVTVTPRALVEQRDVPRLASAGGHWTSESYTGPDSHSVIGRLWDWLPARRDRSRVITPDIAAINLDIEPREARWALAALRDMGCAIPDKRSIHRGLPLPWTRQSRTPEAQEALC